MQRSRQFRDLEEDLLLTEKFRAIKTACELPIAVDQDCYQYLHDQLFEQQLATVKRLTLTNELCEAIIIKTRLRIRRWTPWWRT